MFVKGRRVSDLGSYSVAKKEKRERNEKGKEREKEKKREKEKERRELTGW